MQGPTPGERARSLAYGIAPGVLTLAKLPQRHQLAGHTCDERGRPLVPVPDGSCPARVVAAARTSEVSAKLEITALLPVPVPDRVRGRVWLSGWIGATPDEDLRQAACEVAKIHPWPELLDVGNGLTMLRMRITGVIVEDGWGRTAVALDDYASARPDPFTEVEPDLLTHLNSCHGSELAVLGRQLAFPVHRRPDNVRVVGLDRYGLWLRMQSGDRATTERLSFPEPADEVDKLRHAYRKLYTTASSQ